MKKIGLIVFAAFLGGAVAIGAYKLLERNSDFYTLEEKQIALFANNPVKIASTGAVDFVQAAAAVSPAVVHIKTTYGSKGGESQANGIEDFFEFFGGGGRRSGIPRAASGSGVILTPDGYIATNNHVVDNADKIEVILSNRRKVTAKVVGKDPLTDLALIKVDVTGLPFVKMGNSDNVQVGEWVLAVGFPLDLQTTVTAGIVSAKTRSIGIIGSEQNRPTREEIEEYERTGKMPERSAGNTAIEAFIQTDAAINPGNSGGALVNANGELIGINSAIASQSGRNEGYGFAIPINLAKKILEDFKQFGVVKRGYLGVSFPNPRNEEQVFAEKGLDPSKVQGVYVMDVMPNSAAEAAGIKAGDIIKKIDGVQIYDSPDLQEKIGRKRPGDRVALTVLRANGSSKDINVTLKGESTLAVASAKKPEAATGATIAKLGASFAPASAALKSKYDLNSGVVITAITPDKLFDVYGVPKNIVITTINGVEVNNNADVEKAIRTSRNGMITVSGVRISDGAIMQQSFPAQ